MPLPKVTANRSLYSNQAWEDLSNSVAKQMDEGDHPFVKLHQFNINAVNKRAMLCLPVISAHVRLSNRNIANQSKYYDLVDTSILNECMPVWETASASLNSLFFLTTHVSRMMGSFAFKITIVLNFVDPQDLDTFCVMSKLEGWDKTKILDFDYNWTP